MKNNHILNKLLMAAAVLILAALIQPAARAQNTWCSADSLTWTYNDLSQKSFSVTLRDSATFYLDVSSCPHFSVSVTPGSNVVNVTPLGANAIQSNIVQPLSVTIDDSGGMFFETVALRHLAAPSPPGRGFL